MLISAEITGRIMLLKDALAEYLADVAIRCSAATVSHYTKRLNVLFKGMGNTSLPELTRDDVISCLDRASTWLNGVKVGQLKAPDTIRANVIAWEQFQGWLLERGFISRELTGDLKKPAGRKRELLPTKDETRAILSKAAADFKTIYSAMRLTGARPGELCAATIAQFDRTSGEIVLEIHKTSSKTGKDRRIAVGHPTLVRLINESIGDRTAGTIFLRVDGSSWTADAMSAAFRKARDAAGLRRGLVLYLARHEHGTELYKKTQDIKSVSDALGHSNISTTMRYTRINVDQMKKNQMMIDDGLE
jgi:integrase